MEIAPLPGNFNDPITCHKVSLFHLQLKVTIVKILKQFVEESDTVELSICFLSFVLLPTNLQYLLFSFNVHMIFCWLNSSSCL